MKTLLCAALLLCLPSTALAASMVFTDRASFDAAVGESTLHTFDPLVATLDSLGPFGIDAPTLTVDGFFQIIADRDAFIPNTLSPATGGFCFCSPMYSFGGVTLEPVLAIGFDLTPGLDANLGTPYASLSIAGSAFTVTGAQFVGLVFDEPTLASIVSGFQFTSPSYSIFSIDNVAIKSSAPTSAFLASAFVEPTVSTPEPAPVLLLPVALGLCLLVGRAARRVNL